MFKIINDFCKDNKICNDVQNLFEEYLYDLFEFEYYHSNDLSMVLIIIGDNITVDFGDGTCDRLATVTRNGVSKQITLDRD